jgi:hypothetical protein
MSKNVLILERSSTNLKKTGDKGKTVLEGVFAEFGVENRNGRVYEEKEYLPHLEYLKNDINTGNLLGELDHPERFEVALGNVSHRISELWYEQSSRQIKGRIEILEGTPKGQIAKALLDAGIPLSISSRAAGTVNEDKTVSIQQIYTYDLVAKPGFESAQLKTINESAKSRITGLVNKLNESHSQFEKDNTNITTQLGIINENISIYDVSDKFPQLKLREEATSATSRLNQNNIETTQMDTPQISEDAVQQWTAHFQNELAKLNEKYTKLENSILEGDANEIGKVKKYVEKLRSIQENSLEWQGDIAKAVNKLGDYSDKLAKKNNEHYELTEKIVEAVDYNAKTLNHTQDWTTKIAETVNATASTVDHNADMTNGINEWVTEVSQGVNKLNEWGEEKAKAINGIHEWTSSIAQNLNQTANWSEEMFGRSMSKKDALRLVEYIELIGDNKKNPAMKRKLEESLKANGISGHKISESKYFPEAITTVKKTGNVKVNVDAGKDSGVAFDGKIITAKVRKGKVGGKIPRGLKVLDGQWKDTSKATSDGKKVKGVMTLDTTKVIGGSDNCKGGGPSAKGVAQQQLALDPKTGKQKVNESFDLSRLIKNKSMKLDEKLNKIVDSLENEKTKVHEANNAYPFVGLLNESDQVNFSKLSLSDKKKVAKAVNDNPTTESGNIKNLWEAALTEEGVKETPLYVTAAPENYRKLYEAADETTKATIEAKAEFFALETPYQIQNFWETSGIVESKTPMNEVFTAAIKEQSDEQYDDFVNQIGKAMLPYNNK